MYAKILSAKSAVILILATAGCTPTVNEVEPIATVQSKQLPSRYKGQCVGGKGAMSVPGFWDIENYNKKTGEIRGVWTDRDGYKGRSDAKIINGRIFWLDDISAELDANFGFTFIQDECPGGWVFTPL